MKPLVSICVPTYNGERFLVEALESIEAQTYENCEVVVSDDASSDRTLEIVNKFSSRSRYKYRIFNHEPAGIGANWNHCVEQARGEYIKFLFQDDMLEPECVSEMVQLMETDSEIGLVFSRRSLLISGTPTPKTITWCYMYADPVKCWSNRLSNPIPGSELLKDRSLLFPPRNKVGEPPSVLLRRTVFDDVGLFSEGLKQSLDYEYWYRVFARFKVGFVPKKLNVFRVHAEQTTQQNKKDQISEHASAGLVKHIDPELLHREVHRQATGKRSFYYLVHMGKHFLRKGLIRLLVETGLLKGRQFTNASADS